MLDPSSGKQVGTIARGAAPKVVAGAADVYRYFADWPTKLTGQTMEVSAPPSLCKFFGFMADM